jgi:hypothetical protein
LAPPYIKTATIDSFTDSQLIFTFLTPHATDLLEPRNVVPFYELPIYRTSNLIDLPAANTAHDSHDGSLHGEARPQHSTAAASSSTPSRTS